MCNRFTYLLMFLYINNETSVLPLQGSIEHVTIVRKPSPNMLPKHVPPC